MTDTEIQSTEPFLTKKQKDFASTHLTGTKKWDFLRSRALLNYIVGELLDFPSDPVAVAQSQDLPGKQDLPLVTPSEVHGKIFVSLSHKKNLAAVISSNLPHHGIDLEFLKSTKASLRDRVLNLNERNRFSCSMLDTLTAFSFKEAVYKAINRNFPDIRNFFQCEIVDIKHNTIYAKINSGSAKGLDLEGNFFHLKNKNGTFVITVAKPKNLSTLG